MRYAADQRAACCNCSSHLRGVSTVRADRAMSATTLARQDHLKKESPREGAPMTKPNSSPFVLLHACVGVLSCEKFMEWNVGVCASDERRSRRAATAGNRRKKRAGSDALVMPTCSLARSSILIRQPCIYPQGWIRTRQSPVISRSSH